MGKELAGDPQDTLYTDRIEDKFVFDLSSLDGIIQTIEDHLKPDYPGRDTTYTLVRSIYLDTPDMTLLHDAINDNEPRYKLRVRCYAPNGVWSTDKYVEVKYKEGEIKKKVRILVDMDGFLKILAGQDVPDRIRKLNKDMPSSTYDSTVSLINKISSMGVSPVLQVEYKRYAFRGKTARVTVDTKIKAESLAGLKHYTPPDDVKPGLNEIGKKLSNPTQGVIEIKHAENEPVPDWLDSLIKKYKKSSEGFSKMIWGFNDVL